MERKAHKRFKKRQIRDMDKLISYVASDFDNLEKEIEERYVRSRKFGKAGNLCDNTSSHSY